VYVKKTLIMAYCWQQRTLCLALPLPFFWVYGVHVTQRGYRSLAQYV